MPEGFIERWVIMNNDLCPIMTLVAKRPVRRAAGGTKKTAQKSRTFCISRYRQRSSLLPTVSAYRFTGHMPFLGIHDSGATPLPRNPRTQTWVDDHRSPVYLSGQGQGGIMNRMNRYVTSAIECRSSNWYMINLMHSVSSARPRHYKVLEGDSK